jgi:hypothetical protein
MQSRKSTAMTELTDVLRNALIHSYRDAAQRVHTLSETLSEEQFWTKPYNYGNSFGHLVLHLAGNLNYYVGTQIAGSGYVRDREREFSETAMPPKELVLQQLDATVELVVSAIESQTEDDWMRKYEAVGAADFVNDRFSILLRCATHFHHHVGQMIYLTKEFSK